MPRRSARTLGQPCGAPVLSPCARPAPMPSQSRHSSGAVEAQAAPRRSDHAHRRPHRDRTAAAAAGAGTGAGRRRRRPRVRRGGRPRPERSAPARLPQRALPVHLADHDRRQRQPRPHPARRGRARRRAAERARRPAGAEGPRARAAGGLVRERRDRPRLHGRRPLHRPQRAAAAGRPPPFGPQRPRDRQPAGPLGARRPRPEARGDLAVLQHPAAAALHVRVQRRAVRLQGGTRRPRPRSCCRWSRTPAGSSTPSCWCSPSAAACGSTRCPWTGSTTPTAGSTSSRPPRRPAGHRAAGP